MLKRHWRPARNRTAEHFADGKAVAPYVGEILAVVELGINGQIIVGGIVFVVPGRQSYSDWPFPIAMLARFISERLPAQEVIASQGRTFSLGLAESQFSLTRMS